MFVGVVYVCGVGRGCAWGCFFLYGLWERISGKRLSRALPLPMRAMLLQCARRGCGKMCGKCKLSHFFPRCNMHVQGL